MANVIINDTNLTNIADAIRSKTGSNDTYLPSEMANAISSISSGTVNIGGGSKIYFGAMGTVGASYCNKMSFDKVLPTDFDMTTATNFVLIFGVSNLLWRYNAATKQCEYLGGIYSTGTSINTATYQRNLLEDVADTSKSFSNYFASGVKFNTNYAYISSSEITNLKCLNQAYPAILIIMEEIE